jgi:translation initiation factor IF-2
LAKALPRADGSGPRSEGAAGEGTADKSFPGLGSAVVRPPPGYDPNDPMGNRRRAQAAAAATTRARRPAAPADKPAPGARTERTWRDQATPSRPGGDNRNDKDRRNRRSRRGGRGRFNPYGMDGMPRGRRPRRGKKRTGPKKASPQAKAIKRRVEVQGTITVSQLAHAMSAKSGQVIKTLIGMGQMATANDVLDFDTAQLIAAEFEYEVVNASFQEEKLMIDVEDDPEQMESRPPVVTIMGHVDHGKTTLLDSIRRANVASGEAGGITQHISSYQVKHDGEPITFIDTPGHAAFTAMRARGAEVTDIVVLVVAADDGVMPQTVEVINHAKAAGVDIIVAVNKCDKPDARPERVRQELMQYELVPEEFGGETIFVDISALAGDGIDDLLESISLTAELADLQANPDRHAEGTVLEARLERGKGPVAVVLVQAGTLKRGDHFVAGTAWGRIRALTDHRGKKAKSAGPSTPVEIMGISEVPQAGDNLVVVSSDKDAKTLVEHRIEEARAAALGQHTRMTLEELMKRGTPEEKVTLNLIVKADVGGSLEALKASFAKVEVEGTEIKILHDGVGAVTESDVTLAHTNQAVIIAFNVRPDANARRIVDGYGVEVRTYKVIYEAIDDVEKALKGLLGPEFREVVQGTAEIRQTFSVPKVGTIAGCIVQTGKIARSHSIRLLRQSKIIWEGRLGSLRRFKDDVREVASGYECGMNLDGYNDIKVGDVIEAFTNEEVEAT